LFSAPRGCAISKQRQLDSADERFTYAPFHKCPRWDEVSGKLAKDWNVQGSETQGVPKILGRRKGRGFVAARANRLGGSGKGTVPAVPEQTRSDQFQQRR